MAQNNAYNFRDCGSGIGLVWYRADYNGKRVDLEYVARYHCEGFSADYYRSIFNGTDAEWQRDIVEQVNVLRMGVQEPVPQELVDAFNAWRAEEYAEFSKRMDARPEVYGTDWRKDIPAPEPVRGGHWTRDGWVITAEARLPEMTAA